jgi:hypothetical protein
MLISRIISLSTTRIAEIAIPGHLFADILRLIAGLRPPPDLSPA